MVEILPVCLDSPGIFRGGLGLTRTSCSWRWFLPHGEAGVTKGSGIARGLSYTDEYSLEVCVGEDSLDVGGIICLLQSGFMGFSMVVVPNGRDSITGAPYREVNSKGATVPNTQCRR